MVYGSTMCVSTCQVVCCFFSMMNIVFDDEHDKTKNTPKREPVKEKTNHQFVFKVSDNFSFAISTKHIVMSPQQKPKIEKQETE